MKRFIWVLAGVIGLAACGEDTGESPRDLLFHAANHHEGEYTTGASRMFTIEALEQIDLGVDQEPSDIMMRGRLRVSRVDWIKPSCGPIAHWDYRGEEAVARAVEFFGGLPLTSTSDADAVLEEALPWEQLEPGEDLPELRPNAPDTTMWRLQIAPITGLLETALVGAGKQGTLSALSHTAQNDDGFPIVFAVEDLEASGKAVEVLDYVSEFNDRMLRAYLQEKRPSCLLD